MDILHQKATALLEIYSSWDINILLGYKLQLAAMCLVTYAGYKLVTHHWNLPPGPISLPVIGGLYALKEDGMKVVKDVDRLSKKYGSIFSIDFGSQTWIMITSPGLIKEVLRTRSVEFSDRPTAFSNPLMPFEDEILFTSYSEEWKRKKRIGIQAMKMFGFGTAKGEQAIRNEVIEVIRFIKSNNDTPFKVDDLVEGCAANIMLIIWFGERFDFGSKELKEFIHLDREFFRYIFGDGLFSQLPLWMWRFLFPSYAKRAKNAKDALFSFFLNRVQQHRVTLDKDNPRDAVDVYLSEGDDEEGFNDEIIVNTILSLQVDAINNISESLRWQIIYLCLYPEVQSRIQTEIEHTCGQRPPSASDRQNMPYTEAFIYEVFRISNSMPVDAPHAAANDTTLAGYTIPRDVPIWLNFYSVNMNPDFWYQPQQFNPERHLDSEGKLLKSTKELVTPFGMGRRMCMGEQLARNQMFLLITNLLHQFTLSLPTDKPKPALKCKKDMVFPAVEEYYVMASPR